MASRQRGTRAMNMARHPKASTSIPPPREPVIMPSVPSAAIIPRARPLKSDGNRLVTMAGPSAMSSPLPDGLKHPQPEHERQVIRQPDGQNGDHVGHEPEQEHSLEAESVSRGRRARAASLCCRLRRR